MSRRSRSYDKYIAEKMKDLDFAQESLLTAINTFGDSVEDALKYTILQMGIKEFSEHSGVSIQNISDFVRGVRRLKIETLDKYLSVFGLKAKIIAVAESDVA
jgi:transcriptional regulator with XRE-family HTH domain